MILAFLIIPRFGFAVVINNSQGIEAHISPLNSGEERGTRGEETTATLAPILEQPDASYDSATPTSNSRQESTPKAKPRKPTRINTTFDQTPTLDNLSPIKLGSEIPSDDEASVVSDTRSIASRASSVTTTLGAQPQKRKRKAPKRRLGKGTRDLPYVDSQDIAEEDEAEEVHIHSSPKTKRQRRTPAQRKHLTSPSKDPFLEDDAGEAEQQKQVKLTSEAIARHALGQPHDRELEWMELRDGKVIPHPSHLASRRSSPTAVDTILEIKDGKIEGPAVATGVSTGKQLRDGKVLAPLTIPITPSKRKSPPPPTTPIIANPQPAAMSSVRDRPLLFGAQPTTPTKTQFVSPSRPRTPSPNKKRPRAGSNASIVVGTPEVKSLRNRDVVVGSPIVEEGGEGMSTRGSSVEYEKKMTRKKKGAASAETSPRKGRGRK